MGGQQYADVEKTKVPCVVLPGIECYGERKFLREGIPCIKYTLFPFTFFLIVFSANHCFSPKQIYWSLFYYNAYLQHPARIPGHWQVLPWPDGHCRFVPLVYYYPIWFFHKRNRVRVLDLSGKFESSCFRQMCPVFKTKDAKEIEKFDHLFSLTVGKLLTLGGVGIWWIVDVVLLVSGGLTPEDGSNWVPYM